MPGQENLIFIGYRRATGFHISLAIFRYLQAHGYDVFIDVQAEDNSAPDDDTLRQIAGRTHFLIVLTLGMVNPEMRMGKHLRDELTCAVKTGRNIVPILAHDFQFGPNPEKYPDNLAELTRYSPLVLPDDQFEAAMDRLCNDHLKQTASGALKPVHPLDHGRAQNVVAAAARIHAPTPDELTSEKYMNKAGARPVDDYAGRISDLSEVIRVRPGYYPAYLSCGAARGASGDLEGSISDFNELIRLRPGMSQAYYFRAHARIVQQDFAGAVADFDEAIRLSPNNSQAHFERAIARKRLNDTQGAIEDFGQAIRLKPDFVDAYVARGAIYEDKGDLAPALADYSEALRINPGHAQAYRRRATVLERQGDRQRALADLGEAIRLEPENWLSYFDRARVRRAMGDLRGAVDDLSQQIGLDPTHKEVFNNRGGLRAELGDYAGAIEDLNQAIRLDPTAPMPVANRGWVGYLMEHYPEARADFAQAVGLKSDYKFARSGLALTLYTLGEAEEAKQIWKALIAEEPRYADADWFGKEHNWRPDAVERARKLIAEM